MRILVTRPHPDASRFAQALEARGHQAVVSPLLSFECLLDKAISIHGVQGLLVTSRNAMRALGEARVTGQIFTLPVFAVGRATAAAAHDAGFDDIRVGPGTASGLSAFVKQTVNSQAGSLLHLRGEDTAFDLSASLSASGFDVRDTITYRMAPAATLSEAAMIAIQAGTLDAIMLMSPRTAQVFCEITDKVELRDKAKKLQYICISEAVAEALLPLSPVHVRVATEPCAEEMLALADAMAAQSGQ